MHEKEHYAQTAQPIHFTAEHKRVTEEFRRVISNYEADRQGAK
jgi:hypothetical protein